MLAESGYRQRRSTKDLAVYDPDNDTEFFYLRPRDIAVYVAAGTLDVGITGRDMLLETAPSTGEDNAAGVVKLDGAVETACRLGVADAVCDVVETGTTLRAAGLHIIGEPVLTSEAILVRREGADEIPAVAQLR